MKSVSVPKEVFIKILDDVENLIDDVELALDIKVQKRRLEIDKGIEKGKAEKEYYNYLSKRGIKLDRVRS